MVSCERQSQTGPTCKEQIYKVFNAKTRKTVDQRYRKVMALEEQYVAQMPEAQRIFDFLERHYPKLVNAMENPLVPLTNNTVELVIRRFDTALSEHVWLRQHRDSAQILAPV